MDILLGLALTAHLGFEAGSDHICYCAPKPRYEYNQIHPHVRLEHDNFISGIYYNSERNVSIYGGYRIEKEKLGYEFGLVSGYEQSDIIPFFRTTYNVSDNINIFAAPGYETIRREKSLGLVIGIEVWSF